MSQTSASAGAETAFIHAVAHNENPIRALRAYAEQYHFFSLHQIRAFAGIVAHIPATDRAALSIVASVLHDELGRGIAADVHSVVFERFAASIGVDVRRLPLPETRIIDGVRGYVAELFDAFGPRSTLPRALATYVFLERSAVQTYAPFLAMLRQLGERDMDLTFFELHAVMEIEHEQAAADLANRYLTSREAAKQGQGQMRRMEDAWQSFWVNMRRHTLAAATDE